MTIEVDTSNALDELINNNYISLDIHSDLIPTKTIHIRGENALKWFQILIERAMGNWDRAPHEMKEFADMFIFGTVQQKYHLMDPENTIQNTPPVRT